MLGRRGTRRHRLAKAQYDEFRHLSREWHETLAGRGTRTLQSVENELADLATAIRRGGQPPPPLPWGEAGEWASRQVGDLEAAAVRQEHRAENRTASAAAAAEAAADLLRTADEQEAGQDDAAGERARKLRLKAASKLASAERYSLIAAACAAAAQQARETARLHQVVADSNQSGAEVDAMARAAREQIEVYKAAAAATLPSRTVQHNALPSGRLPHLTVLCRDLNEALAERKAPFRFTPDDLHGSLRAETRRLLSPDGVVLTVGNDPRADVDDLIQIELTLDPGELQEVLDSPVDFDEAWVGQMTQAAAGLTTTATDATGVTAGMSLKDLAAALPDSSRLRALSALASPGAEIATNCTRSTSGGATEFMFTGAVEVLRGQILHYRSTEPRWAWRIRSSARGPWSPKHLVDAGDPTSLDLGYGETLTVGPPAETVSLQSLGLSAERRTSLPENVATRADGLLELCDQAVDGLRERLGGLDRVGYDRLRGLLVEDAMTRLDETTEPGGLWRLITSGGRPVAYAQLETFAERESADLLSDSSPDHKIDFWRVGTSGAVGGRTAGRSRTVSGTLAVAGGPLSDVGTTAADLAPGLRAGRATSTDDGMSTTDQGTRWSGHRLGPTLAMKLRMRHKVTIHRLDRAEAFTVDGEGDVCLRMVEREAFRYGLPVPSDAVVRDAEGIPRRGTDGRLLLRGDPQETDEELRLPAWLGNEPGQLRGAGPAIIGEFEGADIALREFLAAHSDGSLVPPLDVDGQPLPGELTGRDPALLLSLSENLERTRRQLAKPRLEIGYDQLTQEGALFHLSKHRAGLPPSLHNYRITVEQHFDRAKLIGLTDSDTVVNLDMGVNSVARSGSDAKSLPWSAKLGLSNGPALPTVGVNHGRASLGRFSSWTLANSAYRMSMSESGARVAVFDVPHTLKIVEVTSTGDSEPLAVAEGRAAVRLDSEFCDRGVRPTPSITGLVDPTLLQTATIQQVDARDPVGRLIEAVPELARADSAALHHVSGFLATRNLVARPELLATTFRTGLIVNPAPSDLLGAVVHRGLAPRPSSLSISNRIQNLRYVGSGHPVIADLNTTMDSVTSTAGVSTGRTSGVSGGAAQVDEDGSSIGGTLAATKTVSRSSASTESGTAGVERTLFRAGQHYQFWGDLVLQAELRAGGADVREVELDSGAIVLTLPEADALRSYGQGDLDLPLAKASDAVERLLDGNLALPRRTATALIRRYLKEKAGVTDGLAVTHTAERLADKLRSAAGLRPAPDDTLAAVLVKAEDLTRQRVEVALPRHYRTTMGAAAVDRISVQDLEGNDTDLLREVYATIERHDPAALENPVLTSGLNGDFADRRGRGHLESMLDPGGLVREYPIERSGVRQNLRVRVRFAFDGPVTVEGGAPADQHENVWNLVQLWAFRERSRNASATTSYGGTAGGAGSDGISASAGVGTGVGATTTAAGSDVKARISEGFWLDTTRVERDFRLIVEVEDSLLPGGDLVGTVPPPTRRESTGRLGLFVPSSVVGPVQAEEPAEVFDHRPVTLPPNYLTEGTQPYRTGDAPVNTLFEAVYRRLGQPDLLSSAGVRRHRTTLETVLGASGRSVAFRQMADAAGHELVPLPVPGHPRRTVVVRVRAEVSGLELVSDPDDRSRIQLGENTREIHTSQLAAQSNRLLPTTKTVGGTTADGGVTASVSWGEQVAEKDSSTTGARHEVGVYESGEAVTVKVMVDYHLEFERRRVDRHGRSKVTRSDSHHRAAAGEAYLTMFRRDYDAMLARMEAGEPALAGWDPSQAPRSPKAPTVRVSVVADEQHPYRPLVDALEQARLTGAVVRLTVRAQDGTQQVYRANPDGTMSSRGDQKFAAAFAKLHPRLALLAEGRVNLRDVHATSNRPDRFTGAVVEALHHKGIPAAALTEVDPAAGRAPGVGAMAQDTRQRKTTGNPGLGIG
ncbi:hypothetical protein [Kribbella italica]|uniref:Uncharacterized protein n=1 Tax=Kribbella italica TaxID=1540520 RepID=A0A7W9MSL0_9ACTN|nr:hypothetical protein [Kribbella italica]MBB5834287.1 hypothetical protein [Kribbella italica]